MVWMCVTEADRQADYARVCSVKCVCACVSEREHRERTETQTDRH